MCIETLMNRLLVPDSMLGAIFFELPRDVFSTIIGSKSLQRISQLSLHHGMKFMKILEYLTFFVCNKYTHVFREASSIKV